MSRVLGYGGIGNTNGIRDFSGKVEAEIGGRSTIHMRQMGYMMAQTRGFRSVIFLLLGAT